MPDRAWPGRREAGGASGRHKKSARVRGYGGLGDATRALESWGTCDSFLYVAMKLP